MAYQIEYAYTCHIGKIRNNNEDNFWCCGDSLEAQNQGMSHIRSGYMKQSEYPLLAVFDGMGGESCGEMAAFLAAEACGEHFKTAKDGIRLSAITAGQIRSTAWEQRQHYLPLQKMLFIAAILETAGSINQTARNFIRFHKTTSWGAVCLERHH